MGLIRKFIGAALVFNAVSAGCSDDPPDDIDPSSSGGATSGGMSGHSGSGGAKGGSGGTSGSGGAEAGAGGTSAGSGGMEAGAGAGGTSAGSGGASGGLGGAAATCSCKYQNPLEAMCTTTLEQFCAPGGSGCPMDLDAARVAANHCYPEDDWITYEECDNGLASIDSSTAGEVTIGMSFDLATGKLVSGSASGWVAEMCGLPIDIITLSTIEPVVTPPAKECRGCKVCANDPYDDGGGGAGGAGSALPRCIVDAQGRVALPPE